MSLSARTDRGGAWWSWGWTTRRQRRRARARRLGACCQPQPRGCLVFPYPLIVAYQAALLRAAGGIFLASVRLHCVSAIGMDSLTSLGAGAVAGASKVGKVAMKRAAWMAEG